LWVLFFDWLLSHVRVCTNAGDGGEMALDGQWNPAVR
jgi:hypothetical protein